MKYLELKEPLRDGLGRKKKVGAAADMPVVLGKNEKKSNNIFLMGGCH